MALPRRNIISGTQNRLEKLTQLKVSKWQHVETKKMLYNFKKGMQVIQNIFRRIFHIILKLSKKQKQKR